MTDCFCIACSTLVVSFEKKKITSTVVSEFYWVLMERRLRERERERKYFVRNGLLNFFGQVERVSLKTVLGGKLLNGFT